MKSFTAALLICLICGAPQQAYANDANLPEQESASAAYVSLNLSDEVMSYQPMLSEECEKQGMGEYEDVLLAVMMQESAGKLDDVMQSSESAGLAPNSLKSEASIKQGVAYFKDLLALSADRQVDFDTTLQAYNYGKGYIEYIGKNGNTHTQAYAGAYSDEKARELGWKRYGDKKYVFHVYRYLRKTNGLNGLELAPDDYGQLIVKHAKGRIGDPYSQEFRGRDKHIDCSGLAQWCYQQVGIDLPDTAAGQAEYCVTNGLAIEGDTLMPGDLIFYSHKENGRYLNVTHVAIYAGDGMMIDSSSSKGQVVYRQVGQGPVLYARPHMAVSVEPGWKDLGYGNWCYYQEDKTAVTDSWIEYERDWYYLGEDGLMVWESWKRIGNEWYYFDDTGKMVTGEQKIQGRKSLFTDNGEWFGFAE
jgi:cell wall-associated NlpC family hydrolase